MRPLAGPTIDTRVPSGERPIWLTAGNRPNIAAGSTSVATADEEKNSAIDADIAAAENLILPPTDLPYFPPVLQLHSRELRLRKYRSATRCRFWLPLISTANSAAKAGYQEAKLSYALDQETTLTALGDGWYSRPITDVFWNMDSAFGGWALALAVEAVSNEAPPAATLASINAIFLAGIKGESVFVGVDTLSQRKRTGFFRVHLHQDAADGPLLFSADIVMSQRVETDIDFKPVMPGVKPAADVAPLTFPPGMGPRWFSHYDQRIADGAPFTAQDIPRSAVWIRESDDRPLDVKGLVTISDVPMPRTFFLGNTPRFSSTVSYSFSLFATEEELAAIGNEAILVESDSDRVRNGMSDQQARIWSPTGTLIALTNQIAFFR